MLILFGGCSNDWNVDGVRVSINAPPQSQECPDFSGTYKVSEKTPFVLPAVTLPQLLGAATGTNIESPLPGVNTVRIQRQAEKLFLTVTGNPQQLNAEVIVFPMKYQKAYDQGPPNYAMAYCKDNAWITVQNWIVIHAGETMDKNVAIYVFRSTAEGLSVTTRHRRTTHGWLPFPSTSDEAERYEFVRVTPNDEAFLSTVPPYNHH
ncbi:hypothetical protein [Pseudomonas fluorescens]|uniref:hypothetical protein n=1 Tax=Pseudomonas fluorescens TaxID=294 RepID=UPI0012412B69|nr:hypothetical protein [Pseudomonas fluorescens]